MNKIEKEHAMVWRKCASFAEKPEMEASSLIKLGRLTSTLAISIKRIGRQGRWHQRRSNRRWIFWCPTRSNLSNHHQTLLFFSIHLVHLTWFSSFVWFLCVKDAPPQLLRTFNEQTLVPGPFVTFKCAALGNPTPDFIWLLDKYPLLNSDRLTICLFNNLFVCYAVYVTFMCLCSYVAFGSSEFQSTQSRVKFNSVQ